MILSEKIIRKADELGIHQCGIIRVEAVQDYSDRLKERMDRIENGAALYSPFMHFADVKSQFPWAKSIVVAVEHYGHYKLPAGVEETFGKYYLVDSRYNSEALENQRLVSLERYMNELGIKTESSIHPGFTALRWAAHKAGLGIIRKNNFLYTDMGSWLTIHAWAIDAEEEYIHSPSLPQCPVNCGKCIQACPTKSLSEPYTMNMGTCISRLTTRGLTEADWDNPSLKTENWLYGCDACQNVCPMNQNKWEYKDDFPRLAEISQVLSPQKILAMTYQELEEKLMGKFFYIKRDELWRWKINAIRVMVHQYNEAYLEDIANARTDEFKIVRNKADWALGKIHNKETM